MYCLCERRRRSGLTDSQMHLTFFLFVAFANPRRRQPYAIAQLFQKVVEQEKSDLVLLGKQGIDSDCGQTGPMLAGFLGWPQVTFASKLTAQDGGIVVERETDSGTETIACQLPAVVTCDLRLLRITNIEFSESGVHSALPSGTTGTRVQYLGSGILARTTVVVQYMYKAFVIL